MGTTAEKLTYLNTTKGKIKDSINLTGANIGNNDTFRSYAVKLRDGLVNVLNNGTIVLYNNFPKVSGTGSNISLSNTLEAPMFMNKFDGDTLQDGTPTPSNPVDIQSVEGIQNITVSDGTNSNIYEVNLEGKNFVNYADFTASTYVTIDSYNEEDIVATFQGTYRASSLYYNLANQKYVFSVGNISNNSARIELYLYKNGEQIIKTNIYANRDYSFDNTNGIYDQIRLSLSNANLSGTNQITFSKLQLELGTTPTFYVPYRLPIKLYNGDYITGTPDNWSDVRNNGVIDSYNGETITTDYISTTGDLDTGATIVYKLSTPTTTPITDTYLITELNALYNAKSYDGQTNISVSGQLPMILEVSALKDEI